MYHLNIGDISEFSIKWRTDNIIRYFSKKDNDDQSVIRLQFTKTPAGAIVTPLSPNRQRPFPRPDLRDTVNNAGIIIPHQHMWVFVFCGLRLFKAIPMQ